MKPLGWRRSALLDTSCSMLDWDLRLLPSLGGGGGREDESELRTWSFSMGGGGFSSSGSGVSPDSGNWGRSDDAPCMLDRFKALPRLFGGSPISGECNPSSSVSL